MPVVINEEIKTAMRTNIDRNMHIYIYIRDSDRGGIGFFFICYPLTEMRLNVNSSQCASLRCKDTGKIAAVQTIFLYSFLASLWTIVHAF